MEQVDSRLSRFRERVNKINSLVELLGKLEELKPGEAGFHIEVMQKGAMRGSLARNIHERIYNHGRLAMISDTEKELERLLAVEPAEVVEHCRAVDMRGYPATPETAKALSSIADAEAEVGR